MTGYREMVSRVSEEAGLPARTVDRAYRGYWRMVREHIASLPLKGDLSGGEFSSLRPDVSVPSVGKLMVEPGRWRSMRERHKHIQDNKEDKNAANNRSEAHVHQHSGDGRQV